MLTDFGMVTDEAHALGIPVMATIYARGGQIVNELDSSLIAHSIRLGGELGADVVCVPYSGDPQSFSLAVACCPVPVLATGGPNQPDWKSFKAQVGEVMQAGAAAGVCMGRNIFQHPEPIAALAEICELVHTRPEPEEKPKKNGKK